MKKIIKGLIFVFGFIFIVPSVYAAELKVTANALVVNPGDKVRITATASGLTGKFSISNSNNSVLSGATGDDWLENNTGRYEFTAKSVGSATITIKAIDASNSSDGSNWSGSKSITINVVKPREKSTNNNLSGLEVDGYTLEPSFSKDVLEYKVNINKNIDKIKINTRLEDKYAKVSGDGEKEVSEGDNKFEIVVTSETGSKKVYSINVNIHDDNPIIKEIDNKKYTVIKREKSLVLPEELDEKLFTKSTVKFENVDVPVYVSDELKLKLVGLKDESGNIYLFKMSEDKILGKYELITSNKLSVEFSEPKEIIDGYSKINTIINGKEYTTYKNDSDRYVLIYGINLNTNEENWYQYDIKDNTMQLFDDSMLDELNLKEKEYNRTLDKYKLVLLTLGCVNILLFIIFIALAASKSKLKRKLRNSTISANTTPKKETVKSENVIIEKTEEKNDIATKVEDKNKDAKSEKKKETTIQEEVSKAEKEIVDENSVTEEIFASFEEIEEDLKNNSDTKNEEDSDELMDPYDFLDIKKKKRRK